IPTPTIVRTRRTRITETSALPRGFMRTPSSPRNPVAQHERARRAVVVELVVERPRREDRVHRHGVILRRGPEMLVRGLARRCREVIRGTDVRELAGADRQERRSPRDGEPEADHVLAVEGRRGDPAGPRLEWHVVVAR